MTPERYRRVVSIFEAACELPAEQRPGWLARTTGEDAELRQAVEAMLAQDERRSLLHTQGGSAAARLLAGAAEVIPERIGEYVIKGVLGRGGMGTVYRAEQQQPRREVALKTINWWMLSQRAAERLRFEAQALAQLQHPGIPQVYAVVQEGDQLCFAMELIEGIPLDVWAKAASVSQIVALLAEVADAVHHAHLRGLIHRDLKSANIQVTPGGQPKVLDFGISAPVEHGRDTRDVAGTLAYMSPEQLWPENGIDIRSDVYALGVIAYELLCGARPYHPTGEGFEAARASIREVKIPPPGSHRPGLPADLSSILMRAMSWDRAGRYPSAEAFAEELRRFLRNEPVVAHAGGRRYRARKWLRRHRTAAASVSAVGLALSVGGGVSFAQYREAEAARGQEAQMRTVAESEGARAKATVRFLSELLKEADPARSLGEAITIREALRRATVRLDDGALRLQPDVELSVRLTLAEVFRQLGEHEETFRQVERAVALREHPVARDSHEGAQALIAVADLSGGRGDFARATTALADYLELERRLHSDPHEDVSRGLFIGGQLRREMGQLGEAERLMREALSLSRVLAEQKRIPRDEVANTLNQLAGIRAAQGDYDGAEPLFQEALGIDRQVFGDAHPEIAIDLHNLAWIARERGELDAAEALLTQAFDLRVKTLGPRHHRIGQQQVMLADIALTRGDLPRARKLLEDALGILRERHGATHPTIARHRLVEVRLLLAEERVDEARSLAEALFETVRKRYGDENWATAEARLEVARAMTASGAPTAESELRQVLAVTEAQLGPNARPSREAQTLLARIASARTSQAPSR